MNMQQGYYIFMANRRHLSEKAFRSIVGRDGVVLRAWSRASLGNPSMLIINMQGIVFKIETADTRRP